MEFGDSWVSVVCSQLAPFSDYKLTPSYADHVISLTFITSLGAWQITNLGLQWALHCSPGLPKLLQKPYSLQWSWGHFECPWSAEHEIGKRIHNKHIYGVTRALMMQSSALKNVDIGNWFLLADATHFVSGTHLIYCPQWAKEMDLRGCICLPFLFHPFMNSPLQELELETLCIVSIWVICARYALDMLPSLMRNSMGMQVAANIAEPEIMGHEG